MVGIDEPITAAEYEQMVGEGPLQNDMYNFAKLMIQDKKIPQKAKSKWWGFFGKDTILTRSDAKNDRWNADNDFAIRKNFEIMSKPAYKNNINEMVDLDNIRRRFMTQHRRSIGGFERQALMTQIKELRSSRGEAYQNPGLWSGIKKRLGFSEKEEGEQHGSSIR